MSWYNKHRTICYRGLRSVDDIYRLQSTHAENNREPGVHCNKDDINRIKLRLSFHMALNFRLCTLKMLQLLGDCVPRPLIWPLPTPPSSRPWLIQPLAGAAAAAAAAANDD